MNETWWSVLNENKSKIANIISMYCRVGKVEDFENAIIQREVAKLMTLMNDAWYHAPDHRQVYNIPGFSKMCCLLDGTYDDGDLGF